MTHGRFKIGMSYFFSSKKTYVPNYGKQEITFFTKEFKKMFNNYYSNQSRRLLSFTAVISDKLLIMLFLYFIDASCIFLGISAETYIENRRPLISCFALPHWSPVLVRGVRVRQLSSDAGWDGRFIF